MSTETLADVVCAFEDGVRVTVKAQPGRASARGLEVVDIGNGKRAIAVSVKERAVDGKANRALIERLADEWGLLKKQIAIKSGETGRLKIVEIHGDSQSLMAMILRHFA